jgi:hypothetical protein
MGDSYKTCELHGKPFPNNMVDTRKVDIARLYVERKEEIEGKSTTLTLFVGDKTENEGIDVCASCLQEKVLTLLSGNGETPIWKGVSWHQVTMQKKDGSGTYQKNEKTVERVEEIRARVQAEKRTVLAK